MVREYRSVNIDILGIDRRVQSATGCAGGCLIGLLVAALLVVLSIGYVLMTGAAAVGDWVTNLGPPLFGDEMSPRILALFLIVFILGFGKIGMVFEEETDSQAWAMVFLGIALAFGVASMWLLVLGGRNPFRSAGFLVLSHVRFFVQFLAWLFVGVISRIRERHGGSGFDNAVFTAWAVALVVHLAINAIVAF